MPMAVSFSEENDKTSLFNEWLTHLAITFEKKELTWSDNILFKWQEKSFTFVSKSKWKQNH